MSIRDNTANLGEWAEIYVFLKLLGEGRLYAADEHLNRKPDSYVEVLKIIREEIVDMITSYSTNFDDSTVEVCRVDGERFCVPAQEFLDNANSFFDYLSRAKGSVSAPEDVADFLDRIHVTKPKSPSLRSTGSFGGKADIVIKMRDCRSAVVSTMGFSIKSHFASPPTLYNAGSSTQLMYEIVGADDEGMEEFNTIDQRVKRKSWSAASQMYRDHGWRAEFLGAANEVTSRNLCLIRDLMEQILGWVYRRALLEDYDPARIGLRSLCEQLVEENPIGYSAPELVYEKALKDFLYASFAGMTGATPWDGSEQVNGGYIVVKPDGGVLCYHANDREDFRNYLFNQTHIEYVSKKKYNWGRMYKEDGRYYLPLNASVRFYKDFQED